MWVEHFEVCGIQALNPI